MDAGLRGRLALVVSVVAVSCSSTPEGPTIEITDTSWTATPVSVEAGGGSFSITVVNSGTEREEFAVVSLFGGDPATLPMVDGLLDLSPAMACSPTPRMRKWRPSRLCIPTTNDVKARWDLPARRHLTRSLPVRRRR